MNTLKTNLEYLFSDRPEIIDNVMNTVQDRIDSLGENISFETDHNQFIGSCIILGKGVVKITRDEERVIVGGFGNDILDNLDITYVPIENLPVWNPNWNSDIENKWLHKFSNELEQGESIDVVSPNGETSYKFKLSSNMIYYSIIFGNLNIAGGSFIYTPHSKLIVGEQEEKILLALEA